MDKQNNEQQKSDFEFDALKDAHNYRKGLIHEFKGQLKGNIVEVGSGIGQMTESLLKLPDIDFLQCVEPEASFCETFRKKFPHANLIQGTIRDVNRDDWHSIISINVLEHIEDDNGELKMYHNLLKKENGTLNLFVPARPEIYANLDKDFGHYRRYTKSELKKKLVEAGFEIVRICYFNFIGY